jgi:hypothetical protein
MEFHKRFEEEFGSIICDNLTGNDIARKRAVVEGHFMDICPEFVRWCATTVSDMLL